MLGFASAVSLAALILLIIVHMAGHYVVARLCGMHLRVGIGPTILTRTSRTGATFQLRLFPLGAFTEITKVGEQVDPKDPHAYPNRPAWQRWLMVIAGPAANYLFAGVLATGLFVCHGVDHPRWYGVDRVYRDYDAYGKLEVGDRILAVDHVPLYVDEGPSLVDRVRASRGAPMILTIERAGQTRDVEVTPREDSDGRGPSVWRLGVSYQRQDRVDRLGVLEGARLGLIDYPVEQLSAYGKMLRGILFGSDKADPGGPIRITEEFVRAFSTGIIPVLQLVMALSVYWALFTALPLPGADGGRLVFQLFEVVTRRRIDPRIEAGVHKVGIMAYVALNLLGLVVGLLLLLW